MRIPNTDALFVHIPKTGGISIGMAFGAYAKISGWQMYSGVNHGSPGHLGKLWNDSGFRFTFVRNTWDRVLSEYLFRRAAWQHSNSNHRARPVKHLFERDGGDINIFLKLLKKENWWDPNRTDGRPVFRTQMIWLVDSHNNKWGYDFIGRFENFGKDFYKVAKMIGRKNACLGHYNATKRGHYREYYNDEGREFVAKIYEKEIEYLGYEF